MRGKACLQGPAHMLLTKLLATYYTVGHVATVTSTQVPAVTRQGNSTPPRLVNKWADTQIGNTTTAKYLPT